MTANRFSNLTLVASLAAMVVSGCSVGQPAPALQQPVGVVRNALPNARVPLVFVSDFLANVIEIYPQQPNNPMPIGVITDGIKGPLGTFVDQSGKLYVANLLANTVTEYDWKSGAATETLRSGIFGPMSVAVDAAGDIAVGQYEQHQSSIVEFHKGATSPTVTITSLTYPAGLAFDAHQILWAAWNVQGHNALVGHVSRCKLFKRGCTDIGITMGQTGGLAIDKAGDLVVGDQTHSVIDVFAPGTTKPIRKIRLSSHDPYGFVLDRSERDLYIADYPTGTVIVYDYKTGTKIGKIANGITSAWGVSLSPAAQIGP